MAKIIDPPHQRGFPRTDFFPIADLLSFHRIREKGIPPGRLGYQARPQGSVCPRIPERQGFGFRKKGQIGPDMFEFLALTDRRVVEINNPNTLTRQPLKTFPTFAGGKAEKV
jgi:hypothetical protein